MTTDEERKYEDRNYTGLPLEQAIEATQQPKRTKNDIMAELFAYRPEKPVYDAKRPEELKRLANNSVIAKGINLIGDNIALANKANVNQKAPDNTERAYLGQMYNYLDDYTQRVDNWNYRDFANKLRTGELALREANSEASIKAQQEQWQATFDQNQKQYDDAIKRAKEIGDIEKANRLEIMKKDNEYQMQQLKEVSSRYSGGGGSGSGGTRGTKSDGLIIKTKSGKEYQLSDQDASLIYDDMNRNIDVLQKTRPDLFEPGGEYDPVTNQKKLVPKKGISQEQYIRAYLEMQEEQKATEQTPLQQSPIKYPGFPGKEGEKLPEQSQFGKWNTNTTQQPAQTKTPSFFQ